MFDYQAGEKFKLTLLMVGFAGVMAGMFFTMLLMPTPEPEQRKHAPPKWSSDPDITGRPRLPAPIGAAQEAARQGNGAANAAEQQQQQAYAPVDQAAGLSLVESWINLAWDMSANSARQSQEKAIAYMTPDCATAYRQNVWTAEMAKQIEDAGLQSSFKASNVRSGGPQQDGSLVVFVEGQQVLTVPGKGNRIRPVKLEYLLKQTPEGIRIAGISEGGGQGADR